MTVGEKCCYGCRISTSWAERQTVCFYLEFDKPVKESHIDGEKAEIVFSGSTLTIRAGISSVSWENARENLRSDWPASLKAQKSATERAWRHYLQKLTSPYRDREHQKRFYTALYHTAIHPTLYSDANGEYRGMDGGIHKADGWER